MDGRHSVTSSATVETVVVTGVVGLAGGADGLADGGVQVGWFGHMVVLWPRFLQ